VDLSPFLIRYPASPAHGCSRKDIRTLRADECSVNTHRQGSHQMSPREWYFLEEAFITFSAAELRCFHEDRRVRRIYLPWMSNAFLYSRFILPLVTGTKRDASFARATFHAQRRGHYLLGGAHLVAGWLDVTKPSPFVTSEEYLSCFDSLVGPGPGASSAYLLGVGPGIQAATAMTVIDQSLLAYHKEDVAAVSFNPLLVVNALSHKSIAATVFRVLGVPPFDVVARVLSLCNPDVTPSIATVRARLGFAG
jgi:hypothetical protein